ncbi:MAG TPA: hypothetical protein PKG80_01640 [Acidobacteriota bacterium]|nr:hypothetical protein [Acidobacteriota bacterium]
MSDASGRAVLRCRRCGASGPREVGPLACPDCGAPLAYECPRHGPLDGPECPLCAAARAERAARARLEEAIARVVSSDRTAR